MGPRPRRRHNRRISRKCCAAARRGSSRSCPPASGDGGLAILILLTLLAWLLSRLLHGRAQRDRPQSDLRQISRQDAGGPELQSALPRSARSSSSPSRTATSPMSASARRRPSSKAAGAAGAGLAGSRSAGRKPDADGRREYRRCEIPRHLADRSGQARGLRLQCRQSARRR